ncbi:hypothetical protein [Pseudomonas canadensis]|uniref:Formyl transferase N-terminal domain-containing protein n=1 Tax=Pseudomonas canadensis TaxID=915099 RepID=A0ABZ1A1Y0_9PSED|nr:hypothetical protein [Pseudomonas canadensis]WRI23400.1 hypothetical protein SPL95_22740 [Pseudomonas canadensis]
MIDGLLFKVLPEQVPNRNDAVHFDTVFELYQLATTSPVATERLRLLSFLCMRLEITGRLFDAYGVDGKKIGNQLIDSAWAEVALVLLLLDFVQIYEAPEQAPLAFKRLNAMLKLTDFIGTGRDINVDLRKAIDAHAERFLNQHSSADTVETIAPAVSRTVPEQQKVLPITVLFWEGPIARAYLAMLKSMGYRPEKIIHLISAVDLVSKKVVGGYLPAFIREGYAAVRQKNSIHYWASALLKKERVLCDAIRMAVADSLCFEPHVLDDAVSLSSLREYCSVVETLMIDNLADDRLFDYLAKLPETTLLFTGGGIVPARCLQLPALKFIHIHPGYLPDVRGADCVLWSQLIKGRTSASCFFMAPGIDDGDVILPCYLPKVEIAFNTSALPSKMLYRAIYAFFDPWVRAYVLREALEVIEGLNFDQVFRQDDSLSTTYHFMHERIQTVSLNSIFID